MFLQLLGTAMSTKFAPPYAFLSGGYSEETILFPHLLHLHFTLAECRLIEEIIKRFLDDGFVLWPKRKKKKMLILMYLESFLMNYIPH